MNTIQKRFLAFLLLCIPVRIGFVFIAKKVDKKYLPYLGYLAILPAIGFAYIYIFGKRKTGGETFGQKIWWNNLRPIHSILYFIFTYLALKKSNNAYIPLLLDVIIGLISFIIYHYNTGSFGKLI
ncbi:MAG: hypothetical protein CMD50_02020 [Gammaproteobacteria bacterium]|nr:hypothetical protein [Gammaproteobacteria bacterium]